MLNSKFRMCSKRALKSQEAMVTVYFILPSRDEDGTLGDTLRGHIQDAYARGITDVHAIQEVVFQETGFRILDVDITATIAELCED